jgi:hypothetical protein
MPQHPKTRLLSVALLQVVQKEQSKSAFLIAFCIFEHPGLKHKKLKLVHTHDSALKRPCVCSVVGTSFCLADDQRLLKKHA